MSLDYRIKRVDTMVKSWGLDRDHDLIASLPDMGLCGVWISIHINLSEQSVSGQVP